MANRSHLLSPSRDTALLPGYVLATSFLSLCLLVPKCPRPGVSPGTGQVCLVRVLMDGTQVRLAPCRLPPRLSWGVQASPWLHCPPTHKPAGSRSRRGRPLTATHLFPKPTHSHCSHHFKETIELHIMKCKEREQSFVDESTFVLERPSQGETTRNCRQVRCEHDTAEDRSQSLRTGPTLRPGRGSQAEPRRRQGAGSRGRPSHWNRAPAPGGPARPENSWPKTCRLNRLRPLRFFVNITPFSS